MWDNFRKIEDVDVPKKTTLYPLAGMILLHVNLF